MGYDLRPKNNKAGDFHFGAYSFPVLLDFCGHLWPCIHNGGQWYCAFGVDPRMPQGDTYPRILSNDGFKVTAEEARIMARVARNVVAIQRTLPDPTPEELATAGVRQKMAFKREDVEALLMKALGGSVPGPWPVKIRADFTDQFEKFADWSERSGGFEIW